MHVQMKGSSVVASGVAVLATISMIACSASSERKERLMVGTGGTGGEAYIWGGAAAKVVNQYRSAHSAHVATHGRLR